MAPLVLRFASAKELSAFVRATEPSRSCFIATDAEADIGALINVELILGAKRIVLDAEVESVESDEGGRHGLRVGFRDEVMAQVLSFEHSVAPAVDLLGEEPKTDPVAVAADASLLKTTPATKVDLSRFAHLPSLDSSGNEEPALRIEVVPPKSSRPTPLRIDMQPPTPVTPGQPSSVTPGGSPVRIDAQPARPLAPGQPSTVTPGGSPLRIDAQPARPLAPGQPSTVTPGGSPPRIDAQPAGPLSPAQPSSVTPGSSPSGLRRPLGPLITAPPALPVSPAPPPPAAATMPPMSAPRPLTTTHLAHRLAPPRPEGRVGRVGEQVAKLGFPLSPARVAELEDARAALPEMLPIAWVLGVSWVRASTPAALSAITNLTCDAMTEFGGVLDDLSESGARFVFFGLGAQGACVLAAQELRERVEASADGRSEGPSVACAISGGRLLAEVDQPASGDAINSVASLLSRALPGQCVLARNFANGVVDLVGTAPTTDDVQLTTRRGSLRAPLPTVGLEPVLKLFGLRVQAVGTGPVAPLVIAGPRRSGRTHLAQEFARRAHALDAVVGLTTSLETTSLSASVIAELVCQLCGVAFEDRHAQLGPAMERLGVAPVRRAAVLASLGLVPCPTPFTPRQVADAVRLMMAELAKGRRRILIFDGLDHAQQSSLDVVRELLRTPAAGELLVMLVTPERAAALGLESPLAMPTITTADVERLLVESLGTAPSELRDALLARSGGLPGLVVETLLVTVARGALRPRGESLVLDGSVPRLDVEALLDARLSAEGSRCRRLLEAISALGERADAESVAHVLPGVSQEAWPRAASARLLIGNGSGRVSVQGAFASRVSARPVSGPGLSARCAALLSAESSRSTSTNARVASLLERAEEYQRAGAAWRDVAEVAIGTRDFERAAQAQEGMGRVLRRHPRRDVGEVLAMRLELWARAACMRLSLRDLPAARSDLNEGFDAKPPATAHVELLYAHARVAEAEGKGGEAEEVLAEALAASSKHPLHAAVLAMHAERLELKNEFARAQDAWHNALALSGSFLPLAPWFGEVDFKGRVEARVGALFITQTQPSRAHAWLLSSSERFKSAGLPLHASRVMANAGTVSMQLGAFPEAAQWFGAAATQAETGGDFLFQVRQLLALSKVLKRLKDPRLPQVVNATLGLAEALGWDEGVEALRSLSRQGS